MVRWMSNSRKEKVEGIIGRYIFFSLYLKGFSILGFYFFWFYSRRISCDNVCIGNVKGRRELKY